MPKLVRNLILGIVGGIIAGLILGPRAEFLGDFGTLFIRLLKAFATPLLFLGVIDTFCRTQIRLRDGAKLIVWSAINASVALVISLGFTRLLPLDRWLRFEQVKALIPSQIDKVSTPTFSGLKILDSLIPSHLLQPFQDNNVIAVVLLAVIVGVALRSRKQSQNILEPWISEAFAVIAQILHGFVQGVPIAVFCILAKAVGSGGFAWFQTLFVFVLVILGGMLIQVGVYYPLLLRWAGKKPSEFFKQASEALLTAMSTGSSLATLPVTLETLDTKMKIQPRFARLAAAVGTNLNHTGILLYEAVAAVFVARLFGIELSLSKQIAIALTAIVAAVGIAGVPEAGLITLSLVLSSAGLPLEALPLFLPFDWLIGRFRATTNVATDLTVAHLLQK